MIGRITLVNALTAVLPGLSKKELIEQGKCFVFTGTEIITYNDEIAVFHPMETDFKGAVKAEEFFNILRKLKAEELDLLLDEGGGKLTIKTKSTRTAIRLIAEIKLPFDNIGSPSTWTALPENFSRAANLCSGCCSYDFTEMLLRYILCEGTSMWSTDGNRVMRHKLATPVERFYIPAPVGKMLVDYDPKEYAIEGNWIFFKNEFGAVLASRTIGAEEKFPDIKDFFKFDGDVIEMPDRMPESISNCQIFTKDPEEENEIITISIAGGNMTLIGENSYGEHKERLSVASKANMAFKVEPNLLKDAIKLGAIFTIGVERMKIETDEYKHLVSLEV